MRSQLYKSYETNIFLRFSFVIYNALIKLLYSKSDTSIQFKNSYLSSSFIIILFFISFKLKSATHQKISNTQHERKKYNTDDRKRQGQHKRPNTNMDRHRPAPYRSLWLLILLTQVNIFGIFGPAIMVIYVLRIH